ncbi:response regulator [Sphingomonas adhaesiva]|uniref:response regulator n=1 Tax=Sphingomonas adhaesiva TaxID=28212 RepID=UPI002FF85E94
MTPTNPHIILVDDEEDLREPTAAYLSDQGLDVSEADGGRALDALLAARDADLVVLDVTMPEEDGFSIARRLRATGRPTGIIMLTARRDVIDRVVGLELGADDYLMKPFEPRELLARIRSVLRRVASSAAPPATSAPVAAPAPIAPDDGYQQEFWIPTAHGQTRVAVETIEWIEAAKDYALLHTGERSHMIRVTMGALADALDPAQLIRVHRSSFVRPDAVRAINQIGRHTTLILTSGAVVRVGPQYVGEVAHRLKR